jgi:DNA replication protein DnaC
MTVSKRTKTNQIKSNQTESYPVLESHLRSLRLPTMLMEYQQLAKRCSSSNATYEQYLEDMASTEIQKRDSNAISRRIKASKVPTMKELSDFDFGSVPSLNKAKVIELAKCGYITSKTNVVLMGPPGVGKTHLAISLTLNACRQGYNARFFTAAEIVNTYREARESKTIMRLEASLCRMHLIVIDELGYLPIDRHEALSINDKEESFRVKQSRKNNAKKS